MADKLEKVFAHIRTIIESQTRVSTLLMDAIPLFPDSPEKEVLRESCLETQRECARLLEELEPQTI